MRDNEKIIEPDHGIFIHPDWYSMPDAPKAPDIKHFKLLRDLQLVPLNNENTFFFSFLNTTVCFPCDSLVSFIVDIGDRSILKNFTANELGYKNSDICKYLLTQGEFIKE